MQDKNSSQFFSTSKRGEISEWKEMLNSDKEAIRKDTVKKIIAAMTVGKDVSMLFADVLKSIQTNNIELKKLVYLYVMNYARSNPDLAMMAVNTFVTDSSHDNTLVRALAVRTMGCIRVNKIIDYLAEPLQRTMQDRDPYVRKTAAIAVAKLYDLNPKLTVEKGFIEDLQKLLQDPNPMVIANAVAALAEISETSKDKVLEFNQQNVNTLLNAINDCTEWGQVFILDALMSYEPQSEKEATLIIERVIPRFAHANAGVVLSAIKLVLKNMNKIKNPEVTKVFSKKLAAPLITLLNAKSEIQYVALRNISLIVQKKPGLLNKDFKVFFCKYNDPIYVKLEKLDILVKLATEHNIDQILAEFQEYASEVDVQFVRKCVKAIGRCAIKLEIAAQRCIDVLLELIKTKINYVVQEAVVVIKDIFRKYPGKYEGIIGTLCENLDTIDEPDAKASMIWIIGEYADRITNADELLELFTDTFHDEATQVQLQLLTATVKLYLKRPNVGEKLVMNVIKMATKESDNPDLRDRGYIYYRLLTGDIKLAKDVILAEKPVIRDDSNSISQTLLNELMDHISSLASVYQKPPELFVPDYSKKQQKNIADDEDGDVGDDDERHPEVEESRSRSSSTSATTTTAAATTEPPRKQVKEVNLLDLFDSGSSSSTGTSSNNVKSNSNPNVVSFDDLFQSTSSSSISANSMQGGDVRPIEPLHLVLTPDKGKGLQVETLVVRRNRNVEFTMKFTNTNPNPLTGFAIKFNSNSFGLGPVTAGLNLSVAGNGGSATTSAAMITKLPLSDKFNNVLQVAVKTNELGVLYFQDKFYMSVLFDEERVTQDEFIVIWNSIGQDKERVATFSNALVGNIEALVKKLQGSNIFMVSKQVNNEKLHIFMACKFIVTNGTIVITFELVISKNSRDIKLATRTADPGYIPLFEEELQRLIMAE